MLVDYAIMNRKIKSRRKEIRLNLDEIKGNYLQCKTEGRCRK